MAPRQANVAASESPILIPIRIVLGAHIRLRYRSPGFLENGVSVESVIGEAVSQISFHKKIIGKVDSDGKVFNQSGTMLGSVNENGQVLNRNGKKIGSVNADGNIMLIGGAARLLLF